MMWKVPLFDLGYDHHEQEAVMAVLQSRWLTAGAKTREFEEKFAEYLGGNVRCCAVSSGTAGLHLALLIAGVGPGDEVILQGLTFVSDLNIVEMTGATPVLADSTSLIDWNISPEDVARKITPRTRAVIIVHYAGYPCDMDALTALCRKNNILLIEDAAHAIGASYRDKKCGTLGDMAFFSFFSNKNLAVGEGGMFVSAREDYMKHATLLRSHGMTSLTVDRHAGNTISYDVQLCGLNYRIDEIRAALGIVQLDKLENNNRKRSRWMNRYMERLADIDELTIPWQSMPAHRTSSFHIFPVLLSRHVDRKGFMGFLKEKGIQTSIHYPAFVQFSYYRTRIKERLDIAEDISNRVVTLPLFPDMTDTMINQVTDAVMEYFIDQKRTA